jgi:hypothetical protein
MFQVMGVNYPHNTCQNFTEPHSLKYQLSNPKLANFDGANRRVGGGGVDWGGGDGSQETSQIST